MAVPQSFLLPQCFLLLWVFTFALVAWGTWIALRGAYRDHRIQVCGGDDANGGAWAALADGNLRLVDTHTSTSAAKWSAGVTTRAIAVSANE
jgi:hypothetical protein